MLELLSPAGSFDALRAAVCNGADAVYLGVGSFNARMGARNFTLEELPEAVRYCHIRGVQVYVTFNTLVTDREMPGAAEYIAAAARAGADAFIVQDLGMVSLCRQIAPRVPLHASTQMSIHSLEGVRQAAALGLRRVVLARELPREDIAFICRNSPIEIEVFVHGALCMCHSGQCYMSSVIGRRSGNRGQCAQPCRLPYGYDRFEDKYPLSLKDNCLIGSLQELERMGVACIKLEGRMKRPEYVATVTGIYREALNGAQIGRDKMELLRSAFSRQGFTQGYYESSLGRHMFGTRVPEQENKALMQLARSTYEGVESSRVPVRFYAVVARGQNVMVAVQDGDGNICKAQGDRPEPAMRRAISQEEVEARLAKTGGTPFYCEAVRSVVEPGLSIAAAELNRLRREVLSHLTALRGRQEPADLGRYSVPHRPVQSRGVPVLTISVLRAQQITPAMLKVKPEILYVPLSEILGEKEFFQRILRQGQKIGAILPRVIRDDETTRILNQLDEVAAMGIKRVLIGNIGQISLARSRGMEAAGDFGMNLCNSRAMEMQQKLGMVSATASFELTHPQLRDLAKPLPTEMIVYGRLPLMLTENCLIKNRTGACSCRGSAVRLIDRMGEEFRVVRDGDTCRNVILNGKKLYLLDKLEDLRRLGLWALRLSFTTENHAEIDSVLSAWRSGAAFDPGACTRGLYLRGME